MAADFGFKVLKPKRRSPTVRLGGGLRLLPGHISVIPYELTAAESFDSSVCVWDLRLQSFEREAWIKHVLQKPDAPDFEGYLAERLNEYA